MSDANKSGKNAGVEGLPASVRERLTEFTTTLQSTLGADLVGILVHGSVARGEYRPGESDVEVIVILEKAEFDRLEAIGNAMQLARYSARIEATILDESEIAGASDVFPLLYDEIKQLHVVLTGRDPFAAVEVHDTHRRGDKLNSAISILSNNGPDVGKKMAGSAKGISGDLVLLFDHKGILEPRFLNPLQQ